MKGNGMKLLAVALVTSWLATGCAFWSPTKGKTPLWFLQVEVDLPPGWMVATFSEGTFVTRNGIELESIQIRRWPRTTVVKGTNRTIEEGMTPLEIAELSLDSRRLDDGVGGLRVLEIAPIQIDGHDCYRIVYDFRLDSGLQMKTMEYGCAISTWMYRFEYRAASQHYYDAYLEAFEGVRRSAQFKL